VSQLLAEAKALHKKSRAWMDANPVEAQEVKTKVHTTKGKATMAETNAQAAAQLYSTGKPVVEVAKELGITYGKARRLINESGTPIRDASSRLKGRTRPVK
jgi:hypothetical protein